MPYFFPSLDIRNIDMERKVSAAVRTWRGEKKSKYMILVVVVVSELLRTGRTDGRGRGDGRQYGTNEETNFAVVGCRPAGCMAASSPATRPRALSYQ